uniref:VOC family protein n=1 Tax=Pedobacter sp. FW305-3-2-15-E-R2A2 TaxID=3140251 RepID=UPI00406C1AB0
MTLNVPDLPAARDFFQAHLDFKCADIKPNGKISVDEMNTGIDEISLNYFHIEFYLKNEAAVLDKFLQLPYHKILNNTSFF